MIGVEYARDGWPGRVRWAGARWNHLSEVVADERISKSRHTLDGIQVSFVTRGGPHRRTMSLGHDVFIAGRTMPKAEGLAASISGQAGLLSGGNDRSSWRKRKAHCATK